MANINRRNFLTTTAAGTVVTALNHSDARARAAGANERVTLAIIGCGGRATKGLMQQFNGGDAEIAYVCDPDSQHVERAAAIVTAAENRPAKKTADLRYVLDDPAVDGVVIATPDHWHAPAAIMACEAGKHVYVEKPCSHNLREGRLLVEAARRNQRVVQHGTQSRSAQLIADGIQMLREGIIGDVLVAKAWNIQRRDDIGRAQPGTPPAELDYDLWLGPAAYLPYQSNRSHYRWHWWHNYGTGDLGNDGAHEIDYARWGLGVETHPSRISGWGGQIVLPRRPTVSRYTANRLRISWQWKRRTDTYAHLGNAHLVDELSLQYRRRDRILRYRRQNASDETGQVGSVRAGGKTHQGRTEIESETALAACTRLRRRHSQ